MPTASPNVPNFRFPFKHIPDISDEAARQIRRNFEAVFTNLVATTMFDAIIDPTAGGNNAVTHVYTNFSSVVANEKSWASTRVFVVGVRVDNTTKILEPSGTTIAPPGPFAVIAMAAGASLWGNVSSAGIQARQRWDFNGSTITVPTNTVACIQNMEIINSGASVLAPFTGNVAYDNCRVESTAGDATTIKFTNPATGTVGAINTLFESPVFAAAVFAWDSHIFWALTASKTVGPAGFMFYWDGGSFTSGPSATQ